MSAARSTGTAHAPTASGSSGEMAARMSSTPITAPLTLARGAARRRVSSPPIAALSDAAPPAAAYSSSCSRLLSAPSSDGITASSATTAWSQCTRPTGESAAVASVQTRSRARLANETDKCPSATLRGSSLRSR
eukprot:5614834-Prymnesium_polylepis.1